MICGSQGYWTVTFSLEWRMFHQVVNIFHLTGVLVLQKSSRILFCMSLLEGPIRKDPDAGKDWRREEKGMTEDEMVGWHHWLNGHVSLSKFRELVMDRKTWRAAVQGVTKSQTRLSDWTELVSLKEKPAPRLHYLFWLLLALVVARGIITMAWGLLVVEYIQIPDHGLNLGPVHWECGVFTTGPQGKSP